MPAQLTRADSLREYLTGAGSDGGAQADPALSLGNFRSSTEAQSLAVSLAGSLAGASVLFASGGNPIGAGVLTAVDSAHLTWQPFGLAAGTPSSFSGTGDIELVEGPLPGQYLRVSGDTPFTPGTLGVTLSYLKNNVFSMSDVSDSDASTGINEYRATVVKNVSAFDVTVFKRWLGLLGTARVSGGGGLGVSGAGTIVTLTAEGFNDWPDSGWCRVEQSGGTLREVVYYSSRTATILTVPAAGRAQLGTTAAVGSASDAIYPVPGYALAIDPAGVQAAGSAIETTADAHTAPAGVTWNLGITEASGLNVGTLTPGQQVGIWFWRRLPAGTVASPSLLTKFFDSFAAA